VSSNKKNAILILDLLIQRKLMHILTPIWRKGGKKFFVFGPNVYYYKVKLAFSSIKAKVEKIDRKHIESLFS